MAFASQDLSFRCQFCRWTAHDVATLERHIQTVHAEQCETTSSEPRASIEPRLSDFELAQLLAFEEAGLPSELALVDHTNAPASHRRGHNEIAETPWAEHSPSDLQNEEDQTWAECICGERVDILELDAHADMHAQEDVSLADVGLTPDPAKEAQPRIREDSAHERSNQFSTDIPRSLRNYERRSERIPERNIKPRIPTLKEMFLGTSSSPKRRTPYKAVISKQGKTRRLGRAELGPFAHEKQMPNWLVRMLEDGAKVSITNRIGPDGHLQRVETVANETPDLVPVLARLSQLDRTVERAFYCSPDVRHIAKMPREGGFCGYRNIQMLVSYIQEAGSLGHAHFPGRTPSILKLQDLIEIAWDMGINSSGRVETGGIKLTRKYIGTPEAQALFVSLKIPCEATAYASTDTVEASETMLCAVCEYFDTEETEDNVDKVVITGKPPIYFQHQGHSMTIVGIESRVDGQVNLVVYDPMFNPNQALKKLAFAKSRAFKCAEPEKLLKAHRRGDRYLSKYRDFELLKLTPTSRPPAVTED